MDYNYNIKNNNKKKGKKYPKSIYLSRTFILKFYFFLFLLNTAKEQETVEMELNYSFIELKVNGPGNT